jgi:hypothetical protein
MAKSLPTILDAALTLNGMFAGPTFVAFTLGIAIPWASKRGAIVGSITGLAVMAFIGFGQIVAAHMGTAGSSLGDKPAVVMRPLSKENCPASWAPTTLEGRLLATSPASSGDDAESYPHNAMFDIYYMWFTFIGFTITMSIGTLVSWFYPQDVKTLDPLMVSHEIPGVVKALFPKSTGLGEKCEIYYSEIGSILKEKLDLEGLEVENQNDTSPQVKKVVTVDL